MCVCVSACVGVAMCECMCVHVYMFNSFSFMCITVQSKCIAFVLHKLQCFYVDLNQRGYIELNPEQLPVDCSLCESLCKNCRWDF